MAIDITVDPPLPGVPAGPVNPLATVPSPAPPDTDTASNGVAELPPAPSPAPSSGPAATTGAPGEGTVVIVTFDPAGGDGAAAADDLGIDDLVAIGNHAGARGRNDGRDPLGPQGDDLPLDLQVSTGVFQDDYEGAGDAFVAVIDPAGGAHRDVDLGRYLGGQFVKLTIAWQAFLKVSFVFKLDDFERVIVARREEINESSPRAVPVLDQA